MTPPDITQSAARKIGHQVYFMKIWSISLYVFPSADIKINLWMLRCGNIDLMTVIFLDMAEFITLNSIIITTFVQTLIQNCCEENIFPPYFGIEISYKKFYIVTSAIYQMHVLLQHRTRPSYHQLYVFLGPELSERLYHTSDPLVLCMTSYY
jgi:hypothetical protein